MIWRRRDVDVDLPATDHSILDDVEHDFLDGQANLVGRRRRPIVGFGQFVHPVKGLIEGILVFGNRQRESHVGHVEALSYGAAPSR